MILALDTETTGVDFRHGARPFFVTTTDDEGNVRYWGPETGWTVDPLTRAVTPVEEDLDEIWELVSGADRIVMHNGRFDVAALSTLRPVFGDEWPWDRTDDTLIAGHLLASALPHNLTDMAMQYLGEDILPLEERLEVAAKAARSMCRLKSFKEEHGEWALAKEGRPDMPSAKSGSADRDKTFKFDYWLPRVLWERFDLVREEHPEWESVLEEYANKDSEITLALWQVLDRELSLGRPA